MIEGLLKEQWFEFKKREALRIGQDTREAFITFKEHKVTEGFLHRVDLPVLLGNVSLGVICHAAPFLGKLTLPGHIPSRKMKILTRKKGFRIIQASFMPNSFLKREVKN